MEAYSKVGGGLFERGAQKLSWCQLLSWSYSVEIFLPVNCFFDATQTTSRIFFKGLENTLLLITDFSFLVLKALADSQIDAATCLGGGLSKRGLISNP